MNRSSLLPPPFFSLYPRVASAGNLPLSFQNSFGASFSYWRLPAQLETKNKQNVFTAGVPNLFFASPKRVVSWDLVRVILEFIKAYPGFILESPKTKKKL